MAGLNADEMAISMPTPPQPQWATGQKLPPLRRVFGSTLPHIPISSTKSATGHLLGAAGGVESIFSALSATTGQLPPTLNLTHCDEDMQDLDFIPLTTRTQPTQHVLCNGFGFGGVNAALIISQM